MLFLYKNQRKKFEISFNSICHLVDVRVWRGQEDWGMIFNRILKRKKHTILINMKTDKILK
jgi:hypothetical protein